MKLNARPENMDYKTLEQALSKGFITYPEFHTLGLILAKQMPVVYEPDRTPEQEECEHEETIDRDGESFCTRCSLTFGQDTEDDENEA